jgi:AraC-like DNA-binding protein
VAPTHRERFSGHPVSRADDLDEAREATTRTYLPHQLDMLGREGSFRMRLNAVRVGAVTAGFLAYSGGVLMRTVEAGNYHVNIPVSGACDQRCGPLAPVPADPRRAAVFTPGYPAELRWHADSAQLCLMIDRVALDRELEHLLGRPLGKPVRFDTTMNLATPVARSWLATLRVLDEDAVGLTTHPLTACHLQNLIIAGLLLAQRHNYREALHEPSRPAPSRAIRRAADLLDTEPERPWSSTTLAHEVALSVRALQEGFQRAFELPPMTYLREVRLNRVHEALTAPDATTVSAIAARWGFHHPGRFAATYQKKFGRVPTETLRERASRQ